MIRAGASHHVGAVTFCDCNYYSEIWVIACWNSGFTFQDEQVWPLCSCVEGMMARTVKDQSDSSPDLHSDLNS